jgi:hypothetical protein
MRRAVRAKGYPVRWWFGSDLRDFAYFSEIIASERNPKAKKRYRLILYGLYTSIALLIAGFAIIVRS